MEVVALRGLVHADRKCQSFGTRRSSMLNNKNQTRCYLARTTAPMGKITAYKDSWLDKQLLAAFVNALSNVSGRSTKLDGYDAFVDIARKLMHGRTPEQQHQAVGEVLNSLIPPVVGRLFRAMLPPSKLSAEVFAFSTPFVSQWLVGPSKVIEVEVHGVKQRSGVRIEKCRFLENSKCVGTCLNLCKVPTQKFISEELGVPLTMVPNFEDMSCDFIYGQQAPPLEEDPASKQGCYNGLCPTANSKESNCPKI